MPTDTTALTECAILQLDKIAEQCWNHDDLNPSEVHSTTVLAMSALRDLSSMLKEFGVSPADDRILEELAKTKAQLVAMGTERDELHKQLEAANVRSAGTLSSVLPGPPRSREAVETQPTEDLDADAALSLREMDKQLYLANQATAQAVRLKEEAERQLTKERERWREAHGRAVKLKGEVSTLKADLATAESHLHALRGEFGKTSTTDKLREEVIKLEKEWMEERDAAAALRSEKNAAYHERNQLVAALSKLFPARLARHPNADTTWDNDWRWIVFIDLPTGQVSWHIHDSEQDMFGHLTSGGPNTWDGHTTEEKYQRVAALKPMKRVDAQAALQRLEKDRDALEKEVIQVRRLLADTLGESHFDPCQGIRELIKQRDEALRGKVRNAGHRTALEQCAWEWYCRDAASNPGACSGSKFGYDTWEALPQEFKNEYIIKAQQCGLPGLHTPPQLQAPPMSGLDSLAWKLYCADVVVRTCESLKPVNSYSSWDMLPWPLKEEYRAKAVGAK